MNLDINAIARRPEGWHMTECVGMTAAERDALMAVARWAQDAPHKPECMVWSIPAQYDDPCTCGRDEAFAPFQAVDA